MSVWNERSDFDRQFEVAKLFRIRDQDLERIGWERSLSITDSQTMVDY